MAVPSSPSKLLQRGSGGTVIVGSSPAAVNCATDVMPSEMRPSGTPAPVNPAARTMSARRPTSPSVTTVPAWDWGGATGRIMTTSGSSAMRGSASAAAQPSTMPPKASFTTTISRPRLRSASIVAGAVDFTRT